MVMPQEPCTQNLPLFSGNNMDSSSPCPMSGPLSTATSIPISELSPSIENPQQRYLHAVVILLWPFSSSTKLFSLLLSEPDFRLRSSKGQVKVSFRGAIAEAVAKSRIGIGDTVFLSLDGVEWVSRDDEISALARGVDWDLQFADRVLLEVSAFSTLFGR